MPAIRRVAAATAVAASAMALSMFASTAYAAGLQPQPDRLLINRMDGSRLATYLDSVGEGAQAISLRSPIYNYRTAKWTFEVKNDGYYVIKNDAANKCLQPAAATPVEGTLVEIRTCNGSQLQDWSRRPEESDLGRGSGWGAYRPRLNPAVALTLNVYQGAGLWNTLHLNRDQNSADRLWRHLRADTTW